MQQPFLKEHWVELPGGLELHLFLNNKYLVELGRELGDEQEQVRARVSQRVLDYVSAKYPNAPLRTVRVFLGTMLLASVSVGTLAGVPQAEAAAPVYAVVNGQTQPALQPALLSGTMMVEAHALAGFLDAAFTYGSKERKGTFVKGNTTIVLQVDNPSALVNGRTVSAPAPKLEGRQLFVPVRLVAESLNGKVAWDSARSTVVLATEPAVVHGVTAGDSLFKIAKHYGTTVEKIRKLNALPGEMIQPGSELIVPLQAVSYTVKAGDSLFKIAKKHDTTVDAIRDANDLRGDTVLPGENLIVPAAPLQQPAKPKREQSPDASSVRTGSFTFPLPTVADRKFEDTWGDVRTYSLGSGSKRSHEGTDLFAKEGTPVVAVGSGTIINYGWNELGGWRITIQLDQMPYAAYYAHLSKYAPGLGKGKRVATGQVIGYVGSTGYGPEGTSGKFAPHLHFGLYDTEKGFKAVNPYPHLRKWQGQ